MGLLEDINKIDAEVVAGIKTPIEKMIYEKHYGMWRKGMVILKYHPELSGLIEAPAKPGPTAKGEAKPVNFNTVADEIGRNHVSVKKWVAMVVNVGTEKAAFEDWVKAAIQAAYDKETTKLIASDVGPSKTEKQEQKDKFNAVMNAIRARLAKQEPTPEDAKWLMDQVVYFVGGYKKIDQYLVDEHYDRAREVVQKALSRIVE